MRAMGPLTALCQQELKKRFQKTNDDYDSSLLKYLGRKASTPANVLNEVRAPTPSFAPTPRLPACRPDADRCRRARKRSATRGAPFTIRRSST